MNDTGRSLFDRLDSIESKQEKILQCIKQLNTINQHSNHSGQQQLSDREVLNAFIKKAKKDYLWFGSNKEFFKCKRRAVVSFIFLILMGVISTIFTSVALKLYSPFSLFENIIVIEAFFLIRNILCAEKMINDNDLKDIHYDIFKMNLDNLWCFTGKEKKRYKLFRILSYIAIICNIIFIWVQSSGGIAIAATIFEVIFLGLTITSHKENVDLFCMYNNIIIITGRNLTNTDTVKIVYSVISKKFYTFDDFVEQFKPVFNE